MIDLIHPIMVQSGSGVSSIYPIIGSTDDPMGQRLVAYTGAEPVFFSASGETPYLKSSPLYCYNGANSMSVLSNRLLITFFIMRMPFGSYSDSWTVKLIVGTGNESSSSEFEKVKFNIPLDINGTIKYTADSRNINTSLPKGAQQITLLDNQNLKSSFIKLNLSILTTSYLTPMQINETFNFSDTGSTTRTYSLNNYTN